MGGTIVTWEMTRGEGAGARVAMSYDMTLNTTRLALHKKYMHMHMICTCTCAWTWPAQSKVPWLAVQPRTATRGSADARIAQQQRPCPIYSLCRAVENDWTIPVPYTACMDEVGFIYA